MARRMGLEGRGSEKAARRKPLAWLSGEIKSPPFSASGRKEAGDLLRLLQEGETLGMPQAEPLPIIGKRCGMLRIRDGDHSWRIVFRTDPDVVLVLEVFAKKTRAIPKAIVDRCVGRLRAYGDARRPPAS